MFAAHHLDGQKIKEAVAIKIGEVHAHGRKALMAYSQARNGSKMAVPIVDPEAIHGLEVIADIDFRRAVAVYVTHLDRQPKIPGLGFRFALFIEKEIRIPRNCFEMPAAIIKV